MTGRAIYGDCRESMRRLIADGERVQMCVTSPPYFGLRDYGHARQLGLEPTVDEYVANMVEVFGLVRELLADDGVCWLNLGDSYASGPMTGRELAGERSGGTLNGRYGAADNVSMAQRLCAVPPGLKPKDLIGIPWRVAFALQADGWYLRQDIIWHKPNPMPESVRDRCTKAHEYLFLLAKSERYFYNAGAIAEAAANSTARRAAYKNGGAKDIGNYQDGQRGRLSSQSFAQYAENGRNRRSVWTIAPKPYRGAHFATFPPALIEPCILAGSRPGDTVFDPFLGSGTTGEVATRLGRRWLGCELNEDYRPLIEARTAQPGLLASLSGGKQQGAAA